MLTALRVSGVNAIGTGAASNAVSLTSAALPSPVASIFVQFAGYGPDYLIVEWTQPADTGIND